MSEIFDVVILGAGSAGLSALAEVKKVTDNFRIIDPGPIGTTCARTGCMPSKALIQMANDVARTRLLNKQNAIANVEIHADSRVIMKRVRELRDYFTEGAKKAVHQNEQKYVKERARFVSMDTLQVGDKQIRFKNAIIATGSSPILPKAWHSLPLLTSENIFDLEVLPESIAVVGSGPLGIELGQALSRLGVIVTCFSASPKIGGLSDPKLQAEATRILGLEMTLISGAEANVERDGAKFTVSSGPHKVTVAAVLVSTGRRANTANLGLAEIGVQLNEKGLPNFDPRTMRIGDTPLFIAGDAAADRPVLHEASAEGRIAGYNSVREILKFKRYVPLSIGFTEPNIAIVGHKFESLKDFVTGEASFNDQGRARMMSQNNGLLRIYGEKASAKILGAEMVCPDGEHLAHLLAFAVDRDLTALDLLQMPFYHPTIEEGFRSALRDLATKSEREFSEAENSVCETCSVIS